MATLGITAPVVSPTCPEISPAVCADRLAVANSASGIATTHLPSTRLANLICFTDPDLRCQKQPLKIDWSIFLVLRSPAVLARINPTTFEGERGPNFGSAFLRRSFSDGKLTRSYGDRQ